MSRIGPDIDEILDETIDDDRFRLLVRQILDWEGEQLHKTIRHNKKNEISRMITEYLKDQA